MKDDIYGRTSLTSAWWSAVQRAALGFALVTTACTPARKSDMGDNKPAMSDTENPPKTDAPPKPLELLLDEQVILPAKEEARRDKIRVKLLVAAQREFLKLAGIASPEGYSQQLRQMEESANRRLNASGLKVHDRVVVLDPETFETGVALGLDTPRALRAMLQERGVKPDSGLVDGLAAKITTQSPAAMTNLAQLRATACVIVPSSEHALVIDIKGLSAAEQTDFANKHEVWHCLDSKYTLHGMDPKKRTTPQKGPLSANVDNKPVLEIFANGYRKEALADLGAVGDMIRGGGHGIELIDKISDWRAAFPGEVQHLSSPVLKAFKARVEGMGLDAFRRLDEAAATALYFEVTDKSAMSARSIEINLRLEKLDVPGRLAFIDANFADPELDKAVDFMGYYYNKPANNRGAKPLSPEEMKLMDQLRDWDAAKLLDDRAFAASGKITPATLVKAYGAMQDELHAKRLLEPGNTLLMAQMTKLQQTFVHHVQGVDYVQANLDRGVDIVKAEPSLAPPKVKKGGHKP